MMAGTGLSLYFCRQAVFGKHIHVNAAGQEELNPTCSSAMKFSCLVMSQLELVQRLRPLVPRPISRQAGKPDRSRA